MTSPFHRLYLWGSSAQGYEWESEAETKYDPEHGNIQLNWEWCTSFRCKI